jgi:chorismate synthase
MSGSSFGKLLKLTTFGESHGTAIGGIIDGFPSNFEVNFEAIQEDLNRRKPGQSKIVTQRKEDDKVIFLSGIFEGKTTGSPIAFMIENTNSKSKDYDHLKDVFRPSHADFTYEKKYGIRDHRGGGRSSARETASRVVAGSFAKQFLAQKGISIFAYVDQVGSISIPENSKIDRKSIEENPVRCAHPESALLMEELISTTKKKGDTVGGSIKCIIENSPIGLGEPVFDKLHAQLGKAMLSINAAKGFEIGSGFDGISKFGSEQNDIFEINQTTKTNNSGGVQGGISNGMPIEFRVGFKPVATLIQKQESINVLNEKVILEGKGRHDPCVVPRAVPIVEAMAALVLLDFYLIHRAYS